MNTSSMNTAFSRWHPLLKSLLFWIAFLLLLFLIVIFITNRFPPLWERISYGAAGMLAVTLVLLLVKKGEGCSYSDLGLVWEEKTPLRFFSGFGIGTLFFIFLVGPLLLFTGLTIEKNPSPISAWQAFLYISILPLALFEEMAFRSYTFSQINNTYRLLVTQLIIAIAFALYHVVSGWQVYTAFMGPGIWAFVFGLGRYLSGGIAVPTGIHVALNVFQPLLGMKQGSYASVWILQFPEGVSETQKHLADTIGTALQGLLLIGAIGLTIYYDRKEKISRK